MWVNSAPYGMPLNAITQGTFQQPAAVAPSRARRVDTVSPGRVGPRHSALILFGSRARGDSDEASDVDLILVYDTSKRFLDRLEELYRLWDLPIAVDILAYTPAEFEDMRLNSGFVADAVEHGRVIFEAA